MTLKAYPKINIYLKIIQDQGNYHILESRFVLIKNSCFDEIEITESSSDSIQGDFGCDLQDNTIFKALENLRRICDFPPVKIEVAKHIPSGSGLGGGSSDAGSVILGLEAMFGLNLSKAQKQNIARKIGADVGFFLSGYDFAEVRGIGEIIEHKPIMQDDLCEFEIFTPKIFCDTKKVYATYKQMRLNNKLSFSAQGIFAHKSNVEILREEIKNLNDLFIPACEAYSGLLDVQKELGKEWFFSGSGSSFFRALPKEKYSQTQKKTQPQEMRRK